MSMSPDEPAKPSSFAADRVGPLTTSSSQPVAGPPSYPPTEVQRWLICPYLRDYSKKWAPRLEAWTPNKLVGSSIHAGIAAYLEAVRTGASLASQAPEIAACEVLQNGYVQQETWGLAGLEALVKKGTRALIRSVESSLLPGAQIIAVECVVKRVTDVPEGVPGKDHIADCILQRGETLEVWDWKTSLRLDDQYLPDRLLEAHHSWQLLDYAYHGARAFGKPVARVGQGLVILGPKVKVEYSPVAVTPERLNQWVRDATRIWGEMEVGPVWHNWQACSDKHLFYGTRCPMFEGCHTYFGDESLFPALYRLIDGG